MPYRFQWTFPVLISPHDPSTLYVASQFVHKSTDEGASWTQISPDLTVHDPATLGRSGGPIHGDMTGHRVVRDDLRVRRVAADEGAAVGGQR